MSVQPIGQSIYWLSDTSYSFNLQLSSLSWGRFLQPQSKQAPCRGEMYTGNICLLFMSSCFCYRPLGCWISSL